MNPEVAVGDVESLRPLPYRACKQTEKVGGISVFSCGNASGKIGRVTSQGHRVCCRVKADIKLRHNTGIIEVKDPDGTGLEAEFEEVLALYHGHVIHQIIARRGTTLLQEILNWVRNGEVKRKPIPNVEFFAVYKCRRTLSIAHAELIGDV